MYIQYHRQFIKQHKKAPHFVQKRVEKRLRLFAKNQFDPILNNHSLSGNRENQWSINITGDWRAIYEFTGQNSVIFLELGTHGNLYKK